MLLSTTIKPRLVAWRKNLISDRPQQKASTERGVLAITLRTLVQPILDCLKLIDLAREAAVFKQLNDLLLLLSQRANREFLSHRPSPGSHPRRGCQLH